MSDRVRIGLSGKKAHLVKWYPYAVIQGVWTDCGKRIPPALPAPSPKVPTCGTCERVRASQQQVHRERLAYDRLTPSEQRVWREQHRYVQYATTVLV